MQSLISGAAEPLPQAEAAPAAAGRAAKRQKLSEGASPQTSAIPASRSPASAKQKSLLQAWGLRPGTAQASSNNSKPAVPAIAAAMQAANEAPSAANAATISVAPDVVTMKTRTTALSERSWILEGRLPPALASADFEALWALHPPELGTIRIMGKLTTTPRWQQSYNLPYSFSGNRQHAP